MELKRLINKLEKSYPINLKEEWDNVGLCVGDTSQNIDKILVTLDIGDDEIEYAINGGYDMIIAHHPLVFKPVSNINNRNRLGNRLLKLIKANIAVYIIHTNADAAIGGLNDYILEKIGVKESFVLEPKNHETLKFVIFSPDGYAEAIKDRINEINKFSYNNYKNWSFSILGDESFKPLQSAKPAIGKLEVQENVKSIRIETIIYKEQLKEIVNEIKKIHPYEEPAYEIYNTENKFISGGIGRYYNIVGDVNISDYIRLVKEKLDIKNVRAVYSDNKKIRKVAFVNGSGMSFYRKAKDINADIFFTADIKYHEALEAIDSDVVLVDLGHFETEKFFCDMIKELLDDEKEVLTDIYRGKEVFRYM